MDIAIGKTLSNDELRTLRHISSHLGNAIYWSEGYETFLLAVDSAGLILSAFEFVPLEEGMQLAHMYTLDGYKNQGYGQEIMRQAVEIWEVFELPSTNPSDMYYFVDQGLPFTRACFDKGILKAPPFTYPI